MKIVRCIITLVLLSTLSVSLALAEPTSVYISNKPVHFERGSEAIPVLHFIRLLGEEGRDRVELDGDVLVIRGHDEVTHRLLLDSARGLADWSEALELLGYRRIENRATGIVDYRLAEMLDASLDTKRPADHELERRSLRRADYRLARAGFEQVLKSLEISKDTVARERVNRLGQQIVAVTPLSELYWRFELLESPVPNAFCTGEGHVIVTTGLLDLNLTDDELAGVLGHEVAHGVRRHVPLYKERFKEFTDLRSRYVTLTYEYNQALDDGDEYQSRRLKSRLKEVEKRYESARSYLENKRHYDRAEEEESDVLGMRYAVLAGFDPMGEARALIKLQERSVELFGQGYDESNRTHPPLERRLKVLQTVLERWKRERAR